MKALVKRFALPLCFYLAAIVVYLAVCGVRLGLDAAHKNAGTMPQGLLSLEDFTPVSVQVWGEEDRKPGSEAREQFTSTDPDPRLVFETGGAFYVDRLVFDAESHLPGGEVVLYYTTAPGQEYSEHRKVWAQLDANGAWVFDLGGRKVYSLRLDPDTTGGILWTVNRIALNGPVAAWRYFVPDAFSLFLLLTLPGLAAALTLETARALYARKKRKG